MTKIPSLFNALKTEGFSALSEFDPENQEHILATLVLAGDDDDLSSLERHLEKLPRLLKTRILADCNPGRIDSEFSELRFEELGDLIRVGLDWEHPDLSKAPEELQSWMTLDDERTYTLRGDEYSEELPFSIGCAIDPLNFAQKMWHEDGTLDWIEDRIAVADVLCRLNGSSWLIALAILSENTDKDAFQLAAEAAILSATAASMAENSNEFYYNIASGNLEHDPTFDLIYAAVEDIEEQEVLLQSAAVEILKRRNVEHPAIDGAPLSGTNYDDEELAAAKNILKRDDTTPSKKMQKARLYSDIITTNFEEKKTLLELAKAQNAVIDLFMGDEDTLFEKACGDDLLALGAIEIILQKADISSSLKLLQTCSLYRVDYIRNRLAFILN